MFNIGLRKHLKGASKLSERYDYIRSESFPNYSSEIIKDETYDWSFVKNLPYCKIGFHLKLKNAGEKFLKEGGALAKLNLYLIIEGEFDSRFYEYWFDPDDVDFISVKNDIIEDLNFKEYHTYKLKKESWNVFFDFSQKRFSERFRVISPTSLENNEDFNLLPVLLEYTSLNNRYTKRFDFGLLAYYSYDLMEEENPHEYSLTNDIVNIGFLKKSKDVKFKIDRELLGFKSRNMACDLLFSTNHSIGSDIMEEFSLDILNINLGFKWKGISDYKIENPRTELIHEVWEMYKDLCANQKKGIAIYEEMKNKRYY